MKKKQTIWRLFSYCLQHKIPYLILFITMFIGIGLDLVLAWYLNTVTNVAVGQLTANWSWLILIGLIILVLSALGAYIDVYFKGKVSSQIRKQIRIDTLKKVLCLPVSHFRAHHSGELLTRMTNDNQAIGKACSDIIFSLIRNPIMALAAFGYLLTINWQLALICVIVAPMTLLVGSLFGKALRLNSHQLQSRIGKLTTTLQETLSSSTIFKTFGLEKKLLHTSIADSEAVSRYEVRGGHIQGGLSATANGISLFSFVITFLMGAYFTSTGAMTVGGLIAFVQLMSHLTWPFRGLASTWGELQQALGAADRIFQTMDEQAEFTDIPEYRTVPSFKELQFSNLSFGYDTERLVLNNLNLQADAGQKIAIVGPSGSGKTTMFSLLLGFFHPIKGEIRIDGISTADMELDVLRSYFSLVPQENTMYMGTIRENIACGNPKASQSEIVAAARDANALDFISELPDGLETQIGEGGVRLSGGQRQRLSIARAILRNAPILLLDEATAALDNESERLVQEALDRLMVGKTTFVIAHRLSTVQYADKIIVLENGVIVDSGTHEELLAAQGLYHKLYTGPLSLASG